MIKISQGAIIKLDSKKETYVVVSNNTFIKAMGVFYICPLIPMTLPDPTHVLLPTSQAINGTVICENFKLCDPLVHSISLLDNLRYRDIMEISDIIQGIFEYD